DDAEDVALLHNEQVLAIDLDLGAGPFAEQHLVALLDVERHEFAALVAGARPDGNDLTLHRLFLGGVGNDDAAGSLHVLFDAAHDHAVVQRAKLHGLYLTVTERNFPVFGLVQSGRYRYADQSPALRGNLYFGPVSSVKWRVPKSGVTLTRRAYAPPVLARG